MRFWRRGILMLILASLFLLWGCGLEPGLNNEDKVMPLSVDLVVVGDGFGALTASLKASRKGAAVVLFSGEPLDERWMWEEGFLCPKKSSSSRSFEKSVAKAGWSGYQGWQYELLYKNAQKDLDWLIRETGLKASRRGGRVIPKNLSYEEAHHLLKEKVLQEGVRFLESAVIEELLHDDGSALGLGFTDPAGIYNEVYAPVIILADGGFLGDAAQVEELAPGAVAAPWRGGGGAGIKLAREAGLDLVDETTFSYALSAEEDPGRPLLEAPRGTMVIVDDELFLFSELQQRQLMKKVLKSPSESAYLLVPEAGLKEKQAPNWPLYSDFDAFLNRYRLQEPELSRRIGQRGKPFYGCRAVPVASYCLGGVAVNRLGEVLRRKEPVKGLYAMGETAGRLNGGAMIPGLALSETLVWGRRLGTKAAEQLEQ